MKPTHTVRHGEFAVDTVEVGVMTAMIPPASVVILGTVNIRGTVVVSVCGCECHTMMIGKRITSIS